MKPATDTSLLDALLTRRVPGTLCCTPRDIEAATAFINDGPDTPQAMERFLSRALNLDKQDDSP